MKHHSAYLDWYIGVPKVKFDLRSSGLAYFRYWLDLGEVDLSVNYVYGNPETTELLARRYQVSPENVLVSSEGASGLNFRIIRWLAEKNEGKNEAVVEYPTYEPLLRQVQEHFLYVKRLEREEKEAYRLDADQLRKIVSKKTRLLVLTNPHAPSGALASKSDLAEILALAREYGFFVVSDEIYAEFDRNTVPTVSSIDLEYGIVTTSFTKAYGLGGLKLGTALAKKEIVKELYKDVLYTVGNCPNIVQLIATELLANCKEKMEKHKLKWMGIKDETEKWLKQRALEYFPNKIGVTFWVKLPMNDTHKWINDHALPKYGLAPVPGNFFLFKNNYDLQKSNKIRLGLGTVNPDSPCLPEAFRAFEQAMRTWTS